MPLSASLTARPIAIFFYYFLLFRSHLIPMLVDSGLIEALNIAPFT